MTPPMVPQFAVLQQLLLKVNPPSNITPVINTLLQMRRLLTTQLSQKEETETVLIPVMQTPALHHPKSKYTAAPSYEMTPVQQQNPFSNCDNYNIADLSSGDSTDDEDCPKKVIPVWAHPAVLSNLMKNQEDRVDHQALDITKIFPPEELLQDPDLARIFKLKRKRFYQRSSSAHWDSPLMKRSRVNQWEHFIHVSVRI